MSQSITVNNQPVSAREGIHNDHQTRLPGQPLWDWCMVLFLVSAELAYVLLALGVPDTSRDIAEALRICSGEAFPLTGPIFSGRFHLGPYWFYLIAPFACTANPLLTAGLAVGLISALKYPLAYVLGRRLLSRDFALLWLPLLGLFSWPSTLMIYTHTNGLMTFLLLSLLILGVMGKTRIVLSAFLFGIVTSLAINLHPSAFPFILLAILPLWRARRAQCLASTLTMGIAGAVLPFLPVVYLMLQNTGLAEQNSGVLNILTWDSPTRIPRYLWQMVGGPISSVQVTVSQNGFPAGGLWALFCGLCALPLYGSFRLLLARKDLPTLFRVFAGLLGLTLVFALAVASIRIHFPFYMLLVTAIPFTALLAVGLLPLQRWLQSTALVLSVLLIAIPLAGHARSVAQGTLKIPIAEYYDLENIFTQFTDLPYFFWAPVWSFPERAALVCSIGSARLHGYLPLQLNDGLDLMARSCAAGESTNQTDWIALPNSIWEILAKEPARPGRGQGLFAALVVSADADNPRIANTYPPSPVTDVQIDRTLTIRAPADAFLLLSNLYYFTPMEITGIQISEGKAEVLYQDVYATILKCTSCRGQQVDWKITVHAGSASPLDLVAF